MSGCSNQSIIPTRTVSRCTADAPDDRVRGPGRTGGPPASVTCLYPRGPGALSERRRKAVLAMIEQAYGRPLSGTELAASVGLSKGAFHRAFKVTFGVTPFRYLTRWRCEAAAKLMVTTDMSLLTIAVETGFYDQAHLCRQFRKAFGESPDRWRRQERDAAPRLTALG